MNDVIIHHYFFLSFLYLFYSSSLLYSFSCCCSALLSVCFRVVYEPNDQKVNTQCLLAAQTARLYAHIVHSMSLFITEHLNSKFSWFYIRNFATVIYLSSEALSFCVTPLLSESSKMLLTDISFKGSGTELKVISCSCLLCDYVESDTNNDDWLLLRLASNISFGSSTNWWRKCTENRNM